MDSEKLNELISKIKGNEEATTESVNDFLNKSLTADQISAFNKVIQNPDMIKSLLSSDKAKQILTLLNDKRE